jgi:D-alanine-D-alanine ligase
MKNKIKVAIVFGGKSAEHEVSLQSAKNVIEAIDKEKYEVLPIAISKTGEWYISDIANYLDYPNDPKLIKFNLENSKKIAVIPSSSYQFQTLSDNISKYSVDVVFPVLHGPLGEDGTIQGLLKILDIPFVGASVLGSAVAMDKEVAKRLLLQAGVVTSRFISLSRTDSVDLKAIIKQLGAELFVKPVNLGSSIGVTKVVNKSQLNSAVAHAFKYDNKILIEEYILGTEIEVSVLGNEQSVASIPGAVVPNDTFYTYDSKYDLVELIIPADIPASVARKSQQLALQVYKVLCLEGMARVDMFLTPKGELIINEANTIPGFTKMSMYPKLWEATGLPYPMLIDKLIQLAIDRHKKEKILKTSYK